MVIIWSTVVNCTSQVRYGKHPKILNNTVSSKVVYFNESNPLGRHYLYRAELNVSNFSLYLLSIFIYTFYGFIFKLFVSIYLNIFFIPRSVLSNNLLCLSPLFYVWGGGTATVLFSTCVFLIHIIVIHQASSLNIDINVPLFCSKQFGFFGKSL